jgi:3-dehydroquinate synthase II
MRDRVALAPDAPDEGTRQAIVARARQRGFRRFVVAADGAFPAEAGEEVTRRTDRSLTVGTGEVPIETVGTREELDRLLARAADGSTLVLEWTGDRVIPLENAVAHRARKYRLWTFVRSPSEVPAALGALEHGADRAIVRVRSAEEVDALESLLEGPIPAGLEWIVLPLRSVRPAGLGDRVLVDTTSILRPDEGLLVGSAAACLFHVTSEAVGSAFSRPRPFRVNAGAAHSYVLMADGATRYLSELEPGDAVLVTEPAGAARSVRVGRVKVERRPLVLLSADDHDRRRTIFLQEAETVRVSTESGRVAMTELRAGASLRAVRLPAARHLGTAVEETIEER